jgi:hypothetical protein
MTVGRSADRCRPGGQWRRAFYEKLEVSNRAQAIMTALERGLLAPKV